MYLHGRDEFLHRRFRRPNALWSCAGYGEGRGYPCARVQSSTQGQERDAECEHQREGTGCYAETTHGRTGRRRPAMSEMKDPNDEWDSSIIRVAGVIMLIIAAAVLST